MAAPVRGIDGVEEDDLDTLTDHRCGDLRGLGGAPACVLDVVLMPAASNGLSAAERRTTCNGWTMWCPAGSHRPALPLPELAVVVPELAVVVPEALLFLLDDPQAVITRDAVVAEREQTCHSSAHVPLLSCCQMGAATIPRRARDHDTSDRSCTTLRPSSSGRFPPAGPADRVDSFRSPREAGAARRPGRASRPCGPCR